MPDDPRSELERVEGLFSFLQGTCPEGCKIPPSHLPKLTPDQAWTVVWWLGSEYWKVPDYVERCDVCGDLYNSHKEGDCLDFGKSPYHFCGSCEEGEVYAKKRRSRAGIKDRGKVD